MMSPSRAGRRRPSEINLPQKSPTKIEPWTPRRRRPRKACVDRPFVRACFYVLALSVWPTCIYLQSTRWSEEWDATARVERGDLRTHEAFHALDPILVVNRREYVPNADIGMAPPGMGDGWDRTHSELYGLGTERPVELFYKLVLVDIAKKSAVPLCQFVHTGDMHRMLHDAHLRADGRGIDYSGVNLDVMKVIDRRLYDPITNQLKRAVETGRGANAALAEARRTKLTKHHPELAQLVEDVRRIH